MNNTQDYPPILGKAIHTAVELGDDSSALVRHCNKCLAVTAFDLDATCANERALRKRGQTVRIRDAEEVLRMKLERCKCQPNEPTHRTPDLTTRDHE